MVIRIAGRAYCHHKVMCMACIGIMLLVTGEIVKKELIGRGAEFFLVPVIEHLMKNTEKVEEDV